MKFLCGICFTFWIIVHVLFIATEEFFRGLYSTSMFEVLMYLVDRFWSLFYDFEAFLRMLNPVSGYYGGKEYFIDNLFSSSLFYGVHLIGALSIFLAWLFPIIIIVGFVLSRRALTE